MTKMDLRVPDKYVPRFTDIDFGALAAQGRLHYILGLDNTIAERDKELPQFQIEAKITYAQKQGWIRGLTIISNIVFDRVWLITGRSRADRVRRVAKRLDGFCIACVLPNLKPDPAPFLRAMTWMRASPESTVVVGDQIFKDIKGGNVVGALTILVDPLGPDMLGTAFIRRIKEGGIRTRLSL